MLFVVNVLTVLVEAAFTVFMATRRQRDADGHRLDTLSGYIVGKRLLIYTPSRYISVH